MIALDELRAPGVSLKWHEAVALAAALAARMRTASGNHAPAPGAVSLTHEGTLLITSDERQAGSPVQGLAAILGSLIEGLPHPAEIAELVAAVSQPGRPPAGLQEFIRALAFFERPDRDGILRELAVRAAPPVERARAVAAESSRRESARAAAPPPVAAPGLPPAASGRRRFLLKPAMAAAGVAAFMGVALAAATLLTTVHAPEAATAPARGAGKAGGSATGRGSEIGSRAAARVESKAAPEPVEAAAARRPAGPVTPQTNEVVVTVHEAGGAAYKPQTTGVPGDARPSASSNGLEWSRPAAFPSRPAAGGPIYHPGDAGVTAAVLIHPHLPAEPPPDVPPWLIGTLEITVDGSGEVEHVRLMSPGNRYQDRMIVAAAKSWRFKAATKDGRPVRFRTRIKVSV